MIAQSIEALIGNTPLVKINHLSQETGCTILAKCEFMNPTSSVKDRIALNMVNQALSKGTINTHTTIIEPTSGNTGVGLAAICAAKGIKLILTMPESMSIERRKLLTHLGAKLILTPANQGMQGAIDKASALEQELDNAKVLQQFNNEDNPTTHYNTTAKEILHDTQNQVDIFVSAVGTGGTFTGTTQGLKEVLPAMHAVAVEPSTSAVLSGEKAGTHTIQGIGAGFIPHIFNEKLCDEVCKVSDEAAYAMARRAAKEEGLLVGISSGANLHAAYLLAKQPQHKGKTIVTVLCDTAERYLSTALFDH
jgi:cysteine synthase A